MRKVDLVVVHHSASEWGSAEAIEQWHKARPDLGRMGYHYVILNGRRTPDGPFDISYDGETETGAPEEDPAPHCRGHNQTSIGVCLVGNATFTVWQFFALLSLLGDLNDRFQVGLEGVKGHCELDPVNKPLCPGFDMNLVRAGLLQEGARP